ncbi:MAG: DUF502 domain-containing protein [Phycisphaerales bacterium]|jgi:uncharacterized membrane protein|nr:DUF502 domain-containing protein [Phycisphaerales bacterium]
MPKSETRTFRSDFRRFFIKGLAVLLPTVLTLWILVKAYEFIDVTIAQPINGGIRFVMAQATPHLELFQKNFDPSEVAIEKELARLKSEEAANVTMASVTKQLRTNKIMTWWQARWYMNFIGIIVAILAVYIAGRLLGGFLGRRIQGRLERLLTSIPLIKQIYPYVKQVVDFLISDDKPLKFNRVVMVEYPRKGLWSVGLVTGEPMRVVQDHITGVEGPGITVFVPSSPTPFTGYTITVAKDSLIEIPISIDEALRFTISGGVLIPSHQAPRIEASTPSEPDEQA